MTLDKTNMKNKWSFSAFLQFHKTKSIFVSRHTVQLTKMLFFWNSMPKFAALLSHFFFVPLIHIDSHRDYSQTLSSFHAHRSCVENHGYWLPPAPLSNTNPLNGYIFWLFPFHFRLQLHYFHGITSTELVYTTFKKLDCMQIQ